MVETARREGASLILFPEERWRVCHGLADRLDALIMLTGDLSLRFGADEFERFLGRFSRIPRIHISMDRPGEPCCGIDNRSGIRDAVRHIVLTHGVRDIAFLKGPEIHQEACTRFSVYKEALAELGIPFRPELVYNGDFFKESGEKALTAFLDERSLSLKAILCSNDAMALGMIEAVLARGISVPRDLIVIGFDDTLEALTGPVALTTVRQPYREIAERATLEAIALARGEALPAAEPFPTTLMIRNSCGCYSDGIRSISLRPSAAFSPGMTAGPAAWAAEIASAIAAAAVQSSLPLAQRERLAFALAENYAAMENDDASFLHGAAACFEGEMAAGGSPSAWHAALASLGDADSALPGERGHLRSAALRRAHVMAEEGAGRFMLRESEKQYQNQRNADRLVSKILSDLSREKLAKMLSEELPKAGVPSAVVALYGESVDSSRAATGFVPERLTVMCAFGPRVLSVGAGAAYPSGEVFPPGFFADEGRRGDFVVMPLRHADEEFGIILQEVRDPFEGICYDTIGQQAGAAFKRILIEEERRAASLGLESALASLKEANEKLLGLSRQDELSGLLNRRGFMEDAERNLALVRRMSAECVLFFMDMDGLKDINDNYGHDSGDAALRGFSAILGETFRATDSVSRLGGDEFVAFSFMTGSSVPAMLGRIEEALAEFNRASGMPWKLSVSVGAAPYDPDRHPSLESLLKDADEACYREKARRRASR